MPKILICYRRSDSLTVVGRIHELLVRRFGIGSVSIDYTQAVAGGDFRKHLEDAFATADVVLAIVGPDWLGARHGGKAAIENEFDPVRLEIEAAFRAKKTIIPVLVNGGAMPSPEALPPSMRNFSYQNAAVVEAGAGTQNDIERLSRIIDSLEQIRSRADPSQSGGQDIVLPPSAGAGIPLADRISSKIMLSYRRSDSAGMAGRLFDRLRHRFGRERVYMDIDSIPYGTNFRVHIQHTLQDCAVMIAIVGPRWLGGRVWFKPRIFDVDDPVRVEVQTALQQNLPIIPVLLDRTAMPGVAQLPKELREFADLNAAPLDSGRDFDLHSDRLLRSVDTYLA